MTSEKLLPRRPRSSSVRICSYSVASTYIYTLWHGMDEIQFCPNMFIFGRVYLNLDDFYLAYASKDYL